MGPVFVGRVCLLVGTVNMEKKKKKNQINRVWSLFKVLQE